MPRGLRLQAEDVFSVYFLGRHSGSVVPCSSSLFGLKDERDSAPFFLFSLPSLPRDVGDLSSFPLVAVCALGGAAGRLCASGKQRMFAGAAACRNKGNPISQHSGCEQDFSFNAAPSVVLLRPAKLLQLLQPSFCSLSPRKE